MPSVSVECKAVNPVNPEEYVTIVRKLQPRDVPCIYCPHLYTYIHGYYARRPFDLGEVRHDFLQQRRQCPDCKRTFALLPSFVAPFQRYTIVVQDLLVSLLAGTLTVEGALIQLAECGVCLSESCAHHWFIRIQEQVSEIIALFSRLVQFHRSDVPLPPLRHNVRDSLLCAYYERLVLLGAAGGSGFWNLRRRRNIETKTLSRSPYRKTLTEFDFSSKPPIDQKKIREFNAKLRAGSACESSYYWIYPYNLFRDC